MTNGSYAKQNPQLAVSFLPVLRYIAEEAMFNLVLFRGSRWEVGHFNLKSG